MIGKMHFNLIWLPGKAKGRPKPLHAPVQLMLIRSNFDVHTNCHDYSFKNQKDILHIPIQHRCLVPYEISS